MNIPDNNDDLWKLIYLFESNLDAIQRTNLGAVYTPKEIAKFIVKESFSLSTDKSVVPTMLDLCCGSGVFTLAFIEYFDNELGFRWPDIVNAIHACDIDEKSVNFTKMIIRSYEEINNKQPVSFEGRVIVCDALFDDLKTLFNREDGFDMVLSNPPYIKLPNLDKSYRDKLKKLYPEKTFGNFSFSNMFIRLGYNLLSNRGIMGFITQNNFLTTKNAKPLRLFLSENRAVESIINYKDKFVFDDIMAYTCILFATKEKKEKLSYYERDLIKVDDNWRDKSFDISYNGLNEQPWVLSSDIVLRILDKLKKHSTKLRDVADVRVGVATLKDSVFVIDEKTASGLEKEILKPFIKITDKNQNRWIIYPYFDNGGAMSEDFIKKSYPKTYEYLLSKKELLLSRSCKDTPFYLFGRTQGLKSFFGKILTPFYSNKPNFFLDKSDSLFNAGFAVVPKANIDVRLLLRMLNSKIMDFYIKNNTSSISGGYYRCSKDILLEYPIFLPDEKELENLNSLDDKSFNISFMKSLLLSGDEIDFLLK